MHQIPAAVAAGAAFDPRLLLLGGLVLVILIGAGLWAALRSVRVRRGPGGTVEVQAAGRLNVSRPIYRRIARALERPAPAPERRPGLDGLARLRARLVVVYRALMLLVALAGLTFAGILFRDATPGNMLGLPAFLVLLFALAALCEAIWPRAAIRGSGPLDTLRDRFTLEVTHAEPRTLTLDEPVLERVREATRRGIPLEEAARGAYPGFDRLDDNEREALLRALAASLR